MIDNGACLARLSFYRVSLVYVVNSEKYVTVYIKIHMEWGNVINNYIY